MICSRKTLRSLGGSFRQTARRLGIGDGNILGRFLGVSHEAVAELDEALLSVDLGRQIRDVGGRADVEENSFRSGLGRSLADDSGWDFFELMRCGVIPIGVHLSEPVDLGVDVLGARVEHWIVGKLDGGSIIHEHWCRLKLLVLQKLGQATEPAHILCAEIEGPIFGFTG